MMVFYCLISLSLVLISIPIIYFKQLMNALFITFNNKREKYRGYNMVQLFIAIFLGPIIILVSIIIDLVTLPNILLRDTKGFERKYQASSDRLND